ncbi:hypothetical protein LDENG_00055380 [Lucifuga dentata]|nr:hypothetical protein LDENG_00055380 [Lucifuga dentata]
MSSSKCGTRTPLRSLQNEMLHLSSPSTRTRPHLSPDAVKITQTDIPLCDPEPHLHSLPSTNMINQPAVNMPTTGTAYESGDVTFKSFICAGGEVEISGSSMCTEDNIALSKDQASENTCETEDTVISDSVIIQSYSDHREHPYCKSEIRDASSVDIDAAILSEVPNAVLASVDMDNKHVTQGFKEFQNDDCREQDVTFKSFVCDGGEVEVSAVTRLPDDNIPLTEVADLLQCNTTNSSNFSDDCGHLYEAEHADHPYCSSGNDLAPFVTHLTISETSNVLEKLANGLSDVTFKSFNCTGGEIEVSDDTKPADETIPLPTDHIAATSISDNSGINPSILVADHHLQKSNDHLDHPYCNIEYNFSSSSGNLPTVEEALPLRPDALGEVEQMSLLVTGGHAGRQEDDSFVDAEGEVKRSEIKLSEKTALPEGQAMIGQLMHSSVPTCNTCDISKQSSCHEENEEAVINTESLAIITPNKMSLKEMDDEHTNCQVPGTSQKDFSHPEDYTLPSMCHCSEMTADCSRLRASAGTPIPVEVQVLSKCDSEMPSNGAAVLCDSAEKPHADVADVLKVLPELPSIAKAFQFEILSPIVKVASQSGLKVCRDSDRDQFLGEDFALEGAKNMDKLECTGLWAGALESPMPQPLFNSTELGARYCYKPVLGPATRPVEDTGVKPCAMPDAKVEKPVLDIPLIMDGPLQQQLWQMAQFLILASGNMGTAAVSTPAAPSAAPTVKPAKATAADSHSACVGTTPMKLVDHSMNTSGQFERKRDFSLVDACTITDPLLWNVPPGSLECLPRQEVEQKLRSSMIMVEALVQQLTAARAHAYPSAGLAPSDLRDKLVQTQHSEMNQTTMHRDLYMAALSRIGELELDESSLQNLIQSMQDMKATMTALTRDMDAALSNMKETGDIVKEDHRSLVSQYGQMKSLFDKSKETQRKMTQKVKDAFQQRGDMRIQMEEAFTAKEAALSATEQLRAHCAVQISELESSLGSQQELQAALNKIYPEQVAINKAYTEMLNSASDLLSKTMEEQSNLMEELCTARNLLQKTFPMLLKLNEKAAAALRERDHHICMQEQALEEREQIQEELDRANLSLQNAKQQIGDLNLQVTIMTSEMGVLREKLTERDEEQAQLERKVTELSATVSSTLASYTFLEQALGAETTKLQQSWKDAQQASNRADELEASLSESQQHVCELTRVLAESEEQLCQLQAQNHSQNLQIQQLQDVCAQLSSVRETNEFLQMENEVAREQVAESEHVLRTNLQALRERNIECEDLKGAFSQLQLKNTVLQEELEITRSRASATQLDLEGKLEQTFTDIMFLHHTLRELTSELHESLSDKKLQPVQDKESQPVHNFERRHPSSSFVDSIMVALTAENGEDLRVETPGKDIPEPQREALFSESSAFTRIAAVTPKKNVNESDCEVEEEQNSLAKLLADLVNTVTELVSTIKLVQQHKDAQLQELHNTVSGLQEEQQAADSKHKTQVFELQHRLSRLSTQAEKGNLALQQKAQDEKTLSKLMTDINEAQDLLDKHKTDNNELKTEVAELRRLLQQSQVESQVLHEELKKAGGQSANPAHVINEKINLLKEMERLKGSLQELEQGRVKLLERAKRHQIIYQTNQQKTENELHMLDNMLRKVRETLLSVPDVVKNCEQLKQLVEYIG